MSTAHDPRPSQPDSADEGEEGDQARARALRAAPAPEPGSRSADRPILTRPFLRLLGVQASFGFAFSVFLLLPKVLAASFGSAPSEIGLVMAAFGLASVL